MLSASAMSAKVGRAMDAVVRLSGFAAIAYLLIFNVDDVVDA